jgi:hypothetical protein
MDAEEYCCWSGPGQEWFELGWWLGCVTAALNLMLIRRDTLDQRWCEVAVGALLWPAERKI